MTKRRPAGIAIIAILNIVFGTFGLISGSTTLALLGLAGDTITNWYDSVMSPELQKQANGYTQAEFWGYLNQHIPGMNTGQFLNAGVGLVLSLLLIVGGILLWKMVIAGRWITIAYALTDITWRIAGIYFIATTIAPVVSRFFKEVVAPRFAQDPQRQQMMDFMATFTSTTMIGVNVLYFVYPLVVLILMLLPSVGRAFGGEPPPAPPREVDGEDE